MDLENQKPSKLSGQKLRSGNFPIAKSTHWARCCDEPGPKLQYDDKRTKIDVEHTQVGIQSIRKPKTVMPNAQLEWAHSNNFKDLSDCCVKSSANVSNKRSKDAIGSFYGMLYETMLEDLDTYSGTCLGGANVEKPTSATSLDWGNYFRLVEFLVGEMSASDCDSIAPV